MDSTQAFIVAQSEGQVRTSEPPSAVPRAGIEYDGGLILQVTAYWLLALVIAFSVFAMMPKLKGRFTKRDKHFA